MLEEIAHPGFGEIEGTHKPASACFENERWELGFHWHKHEEDDELFFVLSGKLFVDTERGNFELGPNQGVTVPKGVLHRTRAPEKTVVLMVENAGIQLEGN